MIMNGSKKLIFFGNERLATGVTTDLPVLHALREAGYEIAAIITGYNEGRSRNQRELEVFGFVKQYNIPLILPREIDELGAELKNFGAAIGVLVAFGEMLPKSVFTLFPAGIVNIHPSLLPQYRGSTPIETAILEGVESTGVSLMKIIEQTDAGPIYAQAKLNLSGQETKQELTDKLSQMGAKLLVEHLGQIIDGGLQPVAQGGQDGSFTTRFKKENGIINWQKSPARIEREVRAYAGWPKSRTQIFGQDVVITKVRAADGQNDGALVMQAGNGWLEVQELTAPSGRTMSGADFTRGYKK